MSILERSLDRMRFSMRTTLLALFAVPYLLHGQKLKERMATQYAENFDYPKMAAVYEDMIAHGKADVDQYRSLARAYEKMGERDKALGTYGQLVKMGTPSFSDMMHYADLLRASDRYSEAMSWYVQCAAIEPDDPRLAGYIDHPDVFERLKRDSTRCSIRKVGINSPQADLGLTVWDGLLVFSSARGDGYGGKGQYKWDDQPYLNIYSALLKGQAATDPLVFRKELNSRYHDGTASYDSASHRLYFTRDNWHYGQLMKSDNGELKLGIYYSEIVAGEFAKEWGALIPFDHNNPNFNLGHPSVSPDGMKLFFVSDMPGGLGGTDIWYCDKLGTQWGAPQNMGPKVNTPGNEMYPFLGDDGSFYFSSNGHPGLGGMDIFYTRMNAAGPGAVMNMGYPLNTRFNDHGLIVLRDDTTGFFVSDRPGGMGSDDIYGCTVHPPATMLAGVVVDEDTRQPIDGAMILLKGSNGEFIKDFKLDQQPGGKFTIEAPFSEHYTLVTSKNGYLQEITELDAATDPMDNIVVGLKKYDYGAEGVVYNGETMQPLAGSTVGLFDANDQKIEEMVVGTDGKYTFSLKPETDYRLKVEKDGFFKQSARISTKGKPSAVVRTDFKLFPLEVGQVVRLDNIYYDLAKWNIRPDAAIELDKLVQTLKDNPTVRIELSSHTDCRGKDAYNASLSEKRAASAVDYLISKGIAKDRLTSKGYGETKPVESCECTKCTDAQHQSNRRTEFKVLSK